MNAQDYMGGLFMERERLYCERCEREVRPQDCEPDGMGLMVCRTPCNLSITDYHAELCNDRGCSCRGDL